MGTIFPKIAAALIPSKSTIAKLRTVAAGCKACNLWKLGTQTVFGEGGPRSRVMFVGEQPGDQEDVQGKPFVGPAGKILDKGLEAAGIDRKEVYRIAVGPICVGYSPSVVIAARTGRRNPQK